MNKVYLLEVNFGGDWSVHGIYSSWDLADKAGIELCGPKEQQHDYNCYYIEPMDVITE